MNTTQAIQEKVSALAPEEQADVLEYVDALMKKTAQKNCAPGSALRLFASLNIDGPPDASVRFHEYLYGENAR